MKILKAVFIIVFASIIFSCAKKEEQKFTGSMQKITIGIQNSIISGLIIVAQEKGLFKKYGLDVKIKSYDSGKLALLGMLDGECEFSACADMPLSSNFEKGGYLLITTIASSNNSAWIIARKDKGINTPADLAGKKIGTQKNSAVHYFLHTFLIRNIIHEKVSAVYMQASELPEALAKGDIDAFSMRDPYILEAKKLIGEDKLIEFFAPEVYTQFFNLSGNIDFVKANPETIEKIVLSLSESADFISKDKNETIKLFTKYFGEERRENIVSSFDEINYSVGLSKALLLTLENEYSMLISEEEKTGPIPDFLDIFYFDAIKKIKPGSISIIGYRNED